MERFIHNNTNTKIVEKHEAPFIYKDNSHSLDDLLSERILEVSMDRIISVIENESHDFEATEEEIYLSYPASRILVSLLDDRRLMYKYAKSEARIAMEKIIDSKKSKTEIIKELGMETEWENDFGRTQKIEVFEEEISDGYDFLSNHSKVESLRKKRAYKLGENNKYYQDYEIDGKRLKLSLMDFTKVSSKSRINSWETYNYPVEDGMVYIPEEEVDDFIYELIFIKIYDSLPLDVPEEIEEDIRSRGFIEKTRERIPEDEFEYEIDEVREELFPPVIKSLISDVKAGANLKHDERYMVGSFLVQIGMTNDEIVDMFEINNHFAEEPTRKQLRHIRGGDYMPHAYDSIKAIGYDWKEDELEKQVGHPLQYYRQKLRNADESETNKGDED